ncbi:HAD domain-containing protein [Cupriavidus sp. WKF15]|uniref:HAD domain-containing protein n=1 Tax=Cupriavidus sp. WKF15 TaxID=3032282 RepID=UPI0023E10E20|nr:HAD domain-containing protein [Cupriavidus sp. WKF15]WER49966.1 HAD domain-containing protein [Cupriavidus sp. WKF15]
MSDTKGNSKSRVRRLRPPDVLFVDYDNCLHRCDAYVSEGHVVPSEPGVTLFEFAGILEQALQPYPNVKIVISSDWVHVLGFERARDALPPALRARVIGATQLDVGDEPGFSDLSRGEQIRRYVVKHQLTAWVAIDDRRDGFEPYPEQLVHCQPGVGLEDSVVQKLLARRLRLLFYVEWDYG